MKRTSLFLMSVLLQGTPVMAERAMIPMDDIQGYCDEQADAAGLNASDVAREIFVTMCVEAETASVAAEAQGGGGE